MTYTQTGLPNGGNTNRFAIEYDTSLSTERGMQLSAELMNYCDSDYQWLQSFFPGAVIGWLGSRISVKLDNDPARFLSASWGGWGPVYCMHVRIADIPISGMRAVDAVRWLMMIETSEMFMRERQVYPFNDWFGVSNEGNLGESLSQVCGVEFIRTRLHGVAALPGVSWASLWLDAPGRPDFLSANDDTTARLPINGCGTLFLLFLRDQLGFTLDQIIAHGADTLADVYHNLTGDAASNAYTRFTDLVNLHYPEADGPYDPPLETAFPVPSLVRAYADAKLSWVTNGFPPQLTFAFDNPIVAQTTVHFSSSHPNVIQVDAEKRIIPNAESLSVALHVKPQTGRFTQRDVTITASYAGRDMSVSIRVVRPQDLPLSPLTIKAVSNGDRCQRLYEEGTSVTLYVDNIDVFSDRHGLKYTWVVSGATANALNAPQLIIPTLPSAGTSVTIQVTVVNGAGLHAIGQIKFNTLKPLALLDDLDRRVRCKLSSLPAMNAFIPPWVPIVEGPLSLEQINVIQQQLGTVQARMEEAQKLLTQLEHARKKAPARRKMTKVSSRTASVRRSRG